MNIKPLLLAASLSLLFLNQCKTYHEKPVAQERSFDCDFSKPLDPSIASVDDRELKMVDNGVLRLVPFGPIHARGATFKLNFDKPFEMEYKLRVKQYLTNADWFGAWLKCGDGRTLSIVSKERGFILIDKGWEVCAPNIVFEPYGVWKTVKIRVCDKILETYCDGKLVFAKQLSLLPIREIGFATNDVSIEIDDLKIHEIKTIKAEEVKEAVVSDAFAEKKGLFDQNGSPLVQTKGEASFVPGVCGNAVRYKTPASFNVANALSNQAGGIMFWVKAPADNLDSYNTLVFRQGAKPLLSIELKPLWFKADIKRENGLAPFTFTGGSGTYPYKDAWTHFAFVWDRDGVKLFINGLPYNSNGNSEKVLTVLDGTDIEKADTLTLADSVIWGGLTVYKRPVANAEIYEAYRKVMPVDLIMATQIYDASNPITIKAQFAPGGYYMRPMPVEAPFNKATVEVEARLINPADGKVVLEKQEPLRVRGPVDFVMPEAVLPLGAYRLVFDVKGDDGTFYSRSFEVVAARQYANPQVSDSDFKKGKLIYEQKFEKVNSKDFIVEDKAQAVENAGLSYVELGGRSTIGGTDGDRLLFEVPFPKEVKGKPVLIEMRWPDDKPRMMAHYIYRPGESRGRDRLQQGIQSGIEFPCSGKMQTTKYIFFPVFDTYLFDIRSMAMNMPAAIADMKIYEIDGALPKLKINEPDGLPGRKFGHVDEDQSFITNMNYDMMFDENHKPAYDQDQYPHRAPFVYDELIKYMAYTGQNTFHYPLTRYYFSFYPYEGNHFANPHGESLNKVGFIKYFVEALGNAGISFTPILNQTSTPEFAYADFTGFAGVTPDMLMGAKQGLTAASFGGVKSPNFLNPKTQEIYNRHVAAIAGLLKDCKNVEGFECWLNPWQRSTYGYDDWNVAQFSSDTGMDVPEDGRYEFLTGKHADVWFGWRAKKSAEFYKSVRETLDKFNPQWRLYVTIYDKGTKHIDNTTELPSGKDDALKKVAWLKTEESLDIDQIDAISNTFAIPMRWPTIGRWNVHFYNKQNGIDDYNYSYKANNELFRKNGNSIPLVNVFMVYYETFRQPPLKKYNSFFQNSDVKPHGRFWLKELVFDIASMDALELTIGAQPLGTLGREEEAREFAKAYRALPAMSFKDVPGASDPVTVRYLHTKNGTYFYLASLLFTDCNVALKLSKNTRVVDLSTGEATGDFNMKAYQLRSFLVPNEAVDIVAVKVEIPDATKKFYRERLDLLHSAAKAIAQAEGKVSDREAATAEDCEKLYAKGEFAELHRQLFSLEIRSFLKKAESAKLVALQVEMMKKGHVSVNCGSDTFYLAPGGTLFFPDQKFDGSNVYGFYGQHEICMRDVKGMKEAKAPGVFATEAWNIDGYKFKVPNGKYSVKLYMRYAYEPGFKKGDDLFFSLEAQGKPLFTNLNLFEEMKGDMANVVIKEYSGVNVADGVLTLKCIPGKNPTVRHFDAIEVTRE